MVDEDRNSAQIDDDPDHQEADAYQLTEQDEPLNLATDDRKLVTQPYDLGVKGLSQDIATERIKLTIDYQRRYVWDNGKASRLIESLLLNVPIPVCYFAEDENGAYEVIDGLQRLKTISRYLDNEFKLSGISVLTELEGKKFAELNPRDQRRLENRTIRCIVITEDSNPDIKFDVFERLNTGAVSLSAQELRNSVYRGPFNDDLKQLATNPQLRQLLGDTANARMEAEELLLRFFCLVEEIQDYKPPLRQFLNTYLRRKRSANISQAQKALLDECCDVVGTILGSTPFRGPNSRNPVNKAFFDALMVTTAFADRTQMLENAEKVGPALMSMLEDDDFLTAIGRATADRRRMMYRIRFAEQKLLECGIEVHLPGAIEPLQELRTSDAD